jgi:hypothetical protein
MVTAKFDDRKRVVIPQGKPGQVVAIQDNGDGSVTLVPLKPARRKPRFVRFEKRGGYTVGVLDAPINEDALKEALADFPP